MTNGITLNFSDKKNVIGTIQVENESVIKNIFPDYKNQTVTSVQFDQLQKIASNAGKSDVLESADITRGKNKLKTEIIKGNARFDSGVLNFLVGGTFKGDIYVDIPQGTPMSTIKQMYNLPDGALSNYCQKAGCPGGNKDEFETIANQVWFSAEDFAKGNNMTIEEVKALFGN